MQGVIKLKSIQGSAVIELKAFKLSAKKTDKVLVKGRNFHSLSYRYDGKISVSSNGDTIFSKGGSVTYIPKDLSYTTEIIEDMNMAVIHFTLNRDIASTEASVIDIQDEKTRLLFEKIVLKSHIDFSADFSCMSAFYELLSRLEALEETESSGSSSNKIYSIKNYIEKNYSNKSIYIESIAKDFGISTSYLRREFSRTYGISPIAFLRSVRVGNAKNMLESGLLSISEIADICGFSSTSYFIQIFRKEVGEPPDRYRRKIISPQSSGE